MSFTICSIGCGNHAVAAHGPSLRKYAAERPDVRLAACCDVDGERADRFREAFGFSRSYTDFEAMLTAEKPDAVSIATSDDHTAAVAGRVLQLGYPAIIEKPPGRTLAEAAGLAEMAARFGTPNRVAFNRRYMPLVIRLRRELARRGLTGRLQSIHLEMFRIDRRDADFSTTAIHGIDTVRFMAGSDYGAVRFSYRRHATLGPGVKDIYMDCEMANGVHARLAFCPVAGVVIERLTVNAFSQTFFLANPIWDGYDAPGRLVCLTNGIEDLSVEGERFEGADRTIVPWGFYEENASFFDDVRAGRKPAGDIASAVQSVAVAERIRTMEPDYRR